MTVAVLIDAERFPFAAADKARLAGAGVELVEVRGHDRMTLPVHADAVFVYSLRVDESVLDRLPACRVLARCGGGYDNVDVAAALRRGIAVTYVPDYASLDVAEHTVALLFACVRRVTAADAAVRAGRWPSYAELGPMRQLRGQLLGAGRLRADRSDGARARLASGGVRPVRGRRGDARRRSDTARFRPPARRRGHHLLHLPLTEGTRGVFGAPEFGRIKPGALLLNTARGPLVVRRCIDLVGEGGSSSLDLLDDLCGGDLPDEWLRVVVPVGDPERDRCFELGHTSEDSAA